MGSMGIELVLKRAEFSKFADFVLKNILAMLRMTENALFHITKFVQALSVFMGEVAKLFTILAVPIFVVVTNGSHFPVS